MMFGETPYAEFQGGKADVAFDDPADMLATIKRLKAAGVPVVAGRQWGELAVPLRCLTGTDLARVMRPCAMTMAGRLEVTVSRVRFGSPTTGLVGCR